MSDADADAEVDAAADADVDADADGPADGGRQEPLRGTLLVDGPEIRAWAARAVENAVEAGVLSVEGIVVNEGLADSYDDPIERLRRYAGTAREYGPWAPVSALHAVVDPPQYLESRRIADQSWAEGATVRRCEPLPADGLGQRLPEDAVAAVAEGSDVALRFGFGVLKGDILAAPTHGVVSFHHGDVRRYRGRPVGVWEFYHDEPEAGVTLQRLTETLDGGGIVALETVDIGDAATWQEVEARLYALSEELLAPGLERLRDGVEPRSADELGPLYTTPTARETARLLAKNARGRARRFL